jgi:predicted short-subunit dehydrogenase-like oxidoreductase (DUF2520 family)
MKLNIIGSGNVATHLAKKIYNEVEVCTVYSREIINAEKLASEVNSKAINKLSEIDLNADLTLIMVSDNAVKEIVMELPCHLPVVHTSGSISMDVFSNFKNCGILYPLQTFSKVSDLDISSIPFLIEANNLNFENKIVKFCKSILSKHIHITTSQLRSEIHLAAVISNNFITQLLVESNSILKSNNLSLDILEPLINETIKKSFKIGPLNAQTGPAKRNDLEVMNKQYERISNLKLKKIYKLMSELIQMQND